MTLTARKHAWLNRIFPAARQMAGLYLVEVPLVLSWTILAGAALSLLSGSIILLLPLGYLLAATILAWLEHTGSRTRLNCPLQAFGLAEMTLGGGRPTQWQTLRRIVFTPPLILIPGAAFLPGPGGDRTLLQWISGTRIVPLDSALDPRTEAEVRLGMRRAMLRVLSYMISSLVVAGLVFLIPPADPGRVSGGSSVEVQGLSRRDASLLTGYLEMSAIYPDSLEFHVRLASLYYRNGMIGDMHTELEHIRLLDPDHPMLLLGEDLDVTFRDIQVLPDSLGADSVLTVPEEPDTTSTEPVAEDSTSLELQVPGDSAGPETVPPVEGLDEIPPPGDTTEVGPLLSPPDSMVVPTVDTLQSVTEAIPDSSVLSPSPATADSLPVPEPETAPNDTADTGEPELPAPDVPIPVEVEGSQEETGTTGVDQGDQG